MQKKRRYGGIAREIRWNNSIKSKVFIQVVTKKKIFWQVAYTYFISILVLHTEYQFHNRYFCVYNFNM